MKVNVKTVDFSGPFELLLELIASHKIDIGSVSISDIAEQYLSQVSHLVILDVDTASDFMVVATKLLEIKASSLLPRDTSDIDIDEETMTPLEMSEELIERLIVYKQFKNCAEVLGTMMDEALTGFARKSGPTADFFRAEDTSRFKLDKDRLANTAVRLLGKRDQYLLASRHIASKPLDVETYTNVVLARCNSERQIRFRKLVEDCPKRSIVVVTLLAILELYKRGLIEITNDGISGDIEVKSIEQTTNE